MLLMEGSTTVPGDGTEDSVGTHSTPSRYAAVLGDHGPGANSDMLSHPLSLLLFRCCGITCNPSLAPSH